MVSRADLGASDDDSIWYFGEDIYIRRGRHEIVRRNLDSGEEETIYTDSEGMDQVVLEPRLAYIMKKDTIYRLYIPTRQLEPVFTDSALERFYPISNLKIGVYLTNPEWTRYLEETGDTENEHGIPGKFEYIVDLATGEKIEVIETWGEEIDATFPIQDFHMAAILLEHILQKMEALAMRKTGKNVTLLESAHGMRIA